MISVVIYINDQPVVLRAAKNKMQQTTDGRTIYSCDDGTQILHKPEEGAVKLAIKMLETVKQL